jgi:hypothetical protein
MLEYIKSLSNQFYIGEFLYEEVNKKNILGNIGKEQYTNNKEDDRYVKSTYKAFGIDTTKYNSFIDICSNPNTHTIHILDNNKKITGNGISLQIDKGGYKPSEFIENYKDRYKVIYFDLLNDDFDKLQLEKVDYVTGECFVRHNIKDKNTKFSDMVNLNNKLQNSMLKLLALKLKPGGDALILLPFHFDPIVFFNYIFILKKMFNKIGIYKSDKYTPNLSIVYIYGMSFNENFDKKLLDNSNMLFDKTFVNENIKYLDYVYMNINIGLIKSIK